MRQVLDAVEDPIFVKDRQHRFVLLNRAACALLGRPYEELIGRTDHDFLPQEQADIYVANDQLVFETGHTNENDRRAPSRSGRAGSSDSLIAVEQCVRSRLRLWVG